MTRRIGRGAGRSGGQAVGRGVGWVVAIALLWVLPGGVGGVVADEPPAYPQSIEDEIRSLVAAGADQSTDPVFLLKLAALYLDAGDDLYTDTVRRRHAYEEGAKAAWRALEMQDLDPDAHYLYAANLGSAAHLKGVMASALTVRALLRHAERALELDPDHAAALHMMGMMREELPALLGGDDEQALVYLQRAVAADPSYSHAMLNLAKAYLDRDDIRAGEQQLQGIITMTSPRNAYAWRTRHKPEAQALLQALRKRP